MRVKGNVRIFGVPQSFLSHIYSEPSPFFFSVEERGTAGRELRRRNQNRLIPPRFFEIRRLNCAEEIKTSVTHKHMLLLVLTWQAAPLVGRAEAVCCLSASCRV